MGDHPAEQADLSDDEIASLVETRATCPFIAGAIVQGSLDVLNDAGDPLASIEKIRRMGNSGGGDLGDLLVLFASGNHAFMRGDSGKLDRPVPDGLFSLEFPGSQGSHPGHSGILQGDPASPGSGRLSVVNLARLTRRARDGWIRRSDVARFIAENLLADPRSKVFGKKTVALLAGDFIDLVETGGSALMTRIFGSGDDAGTHHRDVEEKLTRLLGEDNLVGSAGEFGLLFAFLANKPGAREIDGEPAVSAADLRAMFMDKRLPAGWEGWKKTRLDWARNTTALLVGAAREYRSLKRHG